MSQEKIDKFLARIGTPSTANSTPKGRIPLKRTRSSPESLSSHPDKKLNSEKNSDEMGSSMKDELLQAFSKMMDDKMALLPTKEDFNLLREEIRSLKTEKETLKMEIYAVKENERQLFRRLEILENKSRKNNIIIKGLAYNNQDNLMDIVHEFLFNVMQIRERPEIVDVHPLGNKTMKYRHILVSFLRNHEKWIVLKQSSRLKGTDWKILQDYSLEVRRRRHNLFRLRWEIHRMNKSVKSVIKTDKLIVNGTTFSWDDTTGLNYNEQSGISKLKELAGQDFSAFINGLLAEQQNPRSTFGTPKLPVTVGHQQSTSIANKA